MIFIYDNFEKYKFIKLSIFIISYPYCYLFIYMLELEPKLNFHFIKNIYISKSKMELENILNKISHNEKLEDVNNY